MTAISSEALIANALVGSNLVMTCAVVEARLRQALIDLCGDQKQKSVCNKMLLLKKTSTFTYTCGCYTPSQMGGWLQSPWIPQMLWVALGTDM